MACQQASWQFLCRPVSGASVAYSSMFYGLKLQYAVSAFEPVGKRLHYFLSISFLTNNFLFRRGLSVEGGHRSLLIHHLIELLHSMGENRAVSTYFR